MYLKNIAAAGLSALLLFSGAVSAGAAETVSEIHDDAAYAAAVETLASNGLAAASATSLQAADGLQLAKEAGLLDDGSGELSLTELTAQALLRETEALQKQNFLETCRGCGEAVFQRAGRRPRHLSRGGRRAAAGQGGQAAGRVRR